MKVWREVWRVVLVVVVCSLWAERALTQVPEADTREAVIARQQEEKARAAVPYVPNRAEALFQRFEREGFPFVGTPTGFYPAFSSVYPGGRLALGAGYRRFTGDSAQFDVHALYSLATYKRVEASFRSPGHARGRLEVGGRVGWMDAPRVSYFGLGSNTTRSDWTVFRMRETYAEAAASWRPVRWLQLTGSTGYEGYDEGSGTGPRTTIEDRFTSITAPRLGEDPSYARGSMTASLLWLDSPTYSRRGGFLRSTYETRRRVDGDGTFATARTEVVQHVPFLRETWVLSLRGRSEAIVGADAAAPYFLLPALGNGHTLRAFQTDRFRDRQSVLLNAEWRWIPSRLALDVALFADAGKVGRTWRDVASGPMTTDYGIGVRFHTPAATALRIEVARGDEGTRLIVASSAAF